MLSLLLSIVEVLIDTWCNSGTGVYYVIPGVIQVRSACDLVAGQFPCSAIYGITSVLIFC